MLLLFLCFLCVVYCYLFLLLLYGVSFVFNSTFGVMLNSTAFLLVLALFCNI